MKTEYQNLETELETLFSDLEKYSHEQLTKKPASGGWSATETMHHLRLSERMSAAYCKKKLSFHPKLKKAGMMTRVRSKFVDYYLRSPLKFKAPKYIDGDNLPNNTSLQDLKALWGEERKALGEFIDQLPEEYRDKEVYKHPFGGRLDIKGMLEFFESHFKHHKKQIYRALNS